MATVKEQVKEVLVGTTEEPQLSQQTRAVFSQHALQDEKTGERYLGEDEFVDAIAPRNEDYVRSETPSNLLSPMTEELTPCLVSSTKYRDLNMPFCSKLQIQGEKEG